MRIVAVLLALVLSISAGWAQPVSPDYTAAKQAFDQSPVADRVALQLMLTSAGYWTALPNVSFSRRLYAAIAQFQSDNGYPASGVLDAAMKARLTANVAPYLKLWGFRAIPHPFRGHPIWVPMGLGLQPARDQSGLVWREPQDRVRMNYEYFPDIPVSIGYDALTNKILSDGGQISYRTLKPNFFVITSSHNGIDSYLRYHRDGTGLLGFSLTWMSQDKDLHIDRAAMLIGDSLWSSMTGGPFPDIPMAAQPEAVSQPLAPTAPKQPNEKSISSGTGFFVNADGNVLTNAHVIEGCSTITVTSEPGTSSPGQVIARDMTNDLAVLKTTLKPGKVAGLRAPIRLGENVEAFGFPLAKILSSSGNFTLGNVTALSGIGDDNRLLQISTPVQPGNSGGPLLDQNGNVVGVVAAKLNVLKFIVATDGDIPQNINFAIKGSVAANFLEANHVAVTPGTASAQMAAPDIADLARSMSVFIQCQTP
ncbi:serine protease [Methylovirgula sp. 4M-Z18]|uniref:serine protease n=1 Tax=Methylovirgula sp. 4M-Z18 TaxID=2293567 RepID=UPI000E2F45E6|nr:serine protease [Methylovirgula sp. 4M-Z18]RFB78918.1 peptidoglycan-binding protein [Methylovirgula sp. 4M-Z18]